MISDQKTRNAFAKFLNAETLLPDEQTAFQGYFGTAAAKSNTGISGPLYEALGRARTQRVAIIGIGDSNQAFGGAGWGYYFTKALAAEYGCFGSGLLPMGQPLQAQLGQYLCGAGRNNVGANTGAPAALDAKAPGGMTVAPSYAYVASGNSITVQGFGQFSMLIDAAHPLDLSGALLWRMSYGTSISGTTTFTPSVRYEAPPYGTLVTGTAQNPVTGAEAVVDYSLALTAGARIAGAGMSFAPAARNTALAGPFVGYYMSCENSGKTTGISYQSLVYHAGAALGDFADDLTTFTAAGLAEYFRQIKLQLTGSNPSAVVFINSGVNDRNATVASRGPNSQTPASGVGAFSDNLDALTAKLRTAWAANGLDQGLLHICFMVSHPFSTPEDSKLVGYREIVERKVKTDANVSCINIPRLASYADFLGGAWWDVGGNSHLKAIGYENVARRAIANAKIAPQ